jgi:hypothetical protein
MRSFRSPRDDEFVNPLLFPRPSKLGRLQIEGGARAGREGRRGVFFSRRPQLSSCYANDEHIQYTCFIVAGKWAGCRAFLRALSCVYLSLRALRTSAHLARRHSEV